MTKNQQTKHKKWALKFNQKELDRVLNIPYMRASLPAYNNSPIWVHETITKEKL